MCVCVGGRGGGGGGRLFVQVGARQHFAGLMFAFYFAARLYLLRYTVPVNCLSLRPHRYAGLMFVSVSVGHLLFMGITYCTSLPICPRLLVTVLSSPYVSRMNYGRNCCSGLQSDRRCAFNLHVRPESSFCCRLHNVSHCDATERRRVMIGKAGGSHFLFYFEVSALLGLVSALLPVLVDDLMSLTCVLFFMSAFSSVGVT